MFSSSLPNLPCHRDELFEFRPVRCSDVRKVIIDIPNNKAPGHHKTPLSVTKDCLPHILPIITSIISLSLGLPINPRALKKAEVVASLREGDHEVPDNKRPISLLAVLSKVAEKLVLRQYTSFLSDRNRLTKHQSGNKRYYSTEIFSLLVTDHLFNAIDEQKVTAMVPIDLSKAFDIICDYLTKQASGTRNIYEYPTLVPKLCYRKGTNYSRWNINILAVNCNSRRPTGFHLGSRSIEFIYE